jgi:hypothetical protein
MFDRIDAFVRDVSKVETEAALSDLLDEISRDMGFAYFALTLGTCAAAFNRRSGLDMRVGHPAVNRAGSTKRGSHASAPATGARSG